MSNRTKSIIFFAARSRVFVSRLFAAVILLIAIFTTHSFSQNSLIDLLFEMVGLFLLTVCSMGRLWSLLYINGNKRLELITEGPYSVVRNPLYLFSFMGAIGIGLVSENLLILALIIVFYVIYYPFTILAEEGKLEVTFGQSYLEYKKVTPRFLPKLSLYKEPEFYMVKTRGFVRNFWYGMWFIWIYMLLYVIEEGQGLGYIHVLWKIP